MDEVPNELSDADSRARDLITQAFEDARRSGRADWHTMTIAVLKNRILQLTDRSFRESDYGARTIAEFVRRYPDLLLVDDSTPVPMVSLRTEHRSLLAPTPVESNRIRPDLWTSVVDYKSGLRYVWDSGTAKPYASGVADQDAMVLPTLRIEELDVWRREFLEAVANLISDDLVGQEQARRWQANRLGTRFLPASLRTPWNQDLKRRVVDRLSTWFAEQDLPAPPDLLQARPTAREQLVGVDTLRQLVLRCVQVMTENELRQVNLSPSVVLRAYGTAIPGRRSDGTRSE